jgi:hypothetical protein
MFFDVLLHTRILPAVHYLGQSITLSTAWKKPAHPGRRQPAPSGTSVAPDYSLVAGSPLDLAHDNQDDDDDEQQADATMHAIANPEPSRAEGSEQKQDQQDKQHDTDRRHGCKPFVSTDIPHRTETLFIHVHVNRGKAARMRTRAMPRISVLFIVCLDGQLGSVTQTGDARVADEGAARVGHGGARRSCSPWFQDSLDV